MASPKLSFVEASVGLTDCSPPVLRSHSITPKAAGLANAAPLSSILPAELATCATVFFPRQSSTPGWVLARLLEGDRCLELRWLSLIQEEPGELDMTLDTMPGLYNELDKQAATPPVRFAFLDPLLPNIHVAEADGALIVHVLSRQGVLTRLTFPGRYFFLSRELDEDISADYALSSLSGRTPLLFHGVSDDVVMVACTDGSLISLRRTASRGENWQETDLSVSSGLWPVRALLPVSFSTRSLASLSSEADSPAAVVSTTSLIGGTETLFDLTYTLSRDYKLRVWQNHSVCARTLDLASGASALLASLPRNLLRATLVRDDPEFAAFLVVAFDDRFLLYGVPRGRRRETELRQIGVQACPHSFSISELRDLQIVKLNPASAAPEQDWVLWTVWEGPDGEPAIAFSELAKAGTGINEPWTRVHPVCEDVWNTDYFDALLASEETRSAVDVFMQHIFTPGRYSAENIFAAAQEYTEHAREALTDRDALYALSRDEYDSLAERVAGIVGCTLTLDISSETGQPLYAQYKSRLRIEWLRFVSLCNEKRTAARFPLALAADNDRQIAFVVTRDTIIAPVQEDAVVADDRQFSSSLDGEDLESSGYVQAAGPVQEAVMILMRASRALQDALDRSSMQDFENSALTTLRSSQSVPYSDLAFLLFAEHVENNITDDVFDGLRDLVVPSLPYLAEACALLFGSGFSRPEDNLDMPVTDFALALAAATTAASASQRYSLALRHLLFLVYLASDTDVASTAAQELLPNAFAFLQGLYVLRWLSNQSAPSLKVNETAQADDSGSLTSRLGGLSMAAADSEAEGETTPAVSLFGLLTRFRLPTRMQGSVASTRALHVVSTNLIDALALLSSHALEVDAPLVKFFVDSSLAAQALNLCELYPCDDAGSRFAKGLAFLALARFEEAQSAFETSAAGLYEESPSLATVLPADVWDSPERIFLYYRLCAHLCLDASFPAGTSALAQLALTSQTGKTSEESGIDVSELVRALWQELFEAQISLQRYDEAFTTLMTMSDRKSQETCLRILVVSMCENGQIEALLRFPFASLQGQLADHLDYRARHARFGSTPDYHRVAYSYHLSRNNHKDAAAVMLRKIKQMDSRVTSERIPFHEAARERCRSYLAVINTLSLVDRNDAWLAVPTYSTGIDDNAPPEGKRRQTLNTGNLPASKRRRLTSGKHIVVDHIPENEHTTSIAHVDVLTLDMLREEYALALAKLTLATTFSELASSEISVDPEGVVALYAEKGEIANAFSVAQTLDSDMSAFFERLTDRAVQLTSVDASISATDVDWLNSLDEAAGLEGTFASRVWHVLRLYLQRYDKPDGRYRLAVLQKMLKLDRTLPLPLWLTEVFSEKDPDGLLRALIAFDRLDEALGQALQLVYKASRKLSKGNGIKAAFLHLPYQLLDRLLQVKIDDDAREDIARNLQQKLGVALEALLTRLDKQHASLVRLRGEREQGRDSMVNGFAVD